MPLKFGNEISNFNSYWACDYLSMLGLKLIHFSKRAQIVFRWVWFDRFVLFVLGDLVICLHGYTWATLGQGLSLIGKSVVFVFHSCNIRIVWGLWSQSNFRDMIISIINVFWLHWIINRLVVMHPYALSHNKAVINWKNFVWSIGLILIQGLITSRSNKQQPTDTVG